MGLEMTNFSLHKVLFICLWVVACVPNLDPYRNVLNGISSESKFWLYSDLNELKTGGRPFKQGLLGNTFYSCMEVATIRYNVGHTTVKYYLKIEGVEDNYYFTVAGNGAQIHFAEMWDGYSKYGYTATRPLLDFNCLISDLGQ
ncbi:hypothetical protein [Catenovulum sediminis]|uniref:hypothetical protein n=1 Tax=Catenovulum sediminis TaxID=1740262 RepID=UPI001180237E|nr:hypothetical protein [Catenovulum sediminis]